MQEQLNIEADLPTTTELHDQSYYERCSFCCRTLKERAAAYGGELLLSEEYDWGVPVGCELW